MSFITKYYRLRYEQNNSLSTPDDTWSQRTLWTRSPKQSLTALRKPTQFAGRLCTCFCGISDVCWCFITNWFTGYAFVDNSIDELNKTSNRNDRCLGVLLSWCRCKSKIKKWQFYTQNHFLIWFLYSHHCKKCISYRS